MPFSIAQPIRQETTPYVFFKDLYTPPECQAIIDMSKELKAETAKVGGGENPAGDVNAAKRITEIFWINWEAKNTWLFQKLADSVSGANAKWWGFHLAGLNEALQLTHYRGEESGHYDWHEDASWAGNFQLRKISAVVLLNDDFEGGDFEFLHSGKPQELSKGTLILFPSYMTHRVTKVTKGERWSLVSWVSGPPWI